MKAKPLKLVNGRYDECLTADATHLMICLPGPFPTRILPVIRNGDRKGTHRWSWNGSTDAPSLKPSVRTTDGTELCHCYVTQGKVAFLTDCTHEFAGKTMEMHDVD